MFGNNDYCNCDPCWLEDDPTDEEIEIANQNLDYDDYRCTCTGDYCVC